MKSILRFLSYTSVNTNGCWIWRGGFSGDGYGGFRHKNKQISAHRFSAKYLGGCEIDGKTVRHTCDNPKCVNPGHLIAGTHKENMRDMATRNRSAKPHGELNGNSKLTETDVIEIRSSTKSSRQIAPAYGVSATQIQRIRKGTRWRYDCSENLKQPAQSSQVDK